MEINTRQTTVVNGAGQIVLNSGDIFKIMKNDEIIKEFTIPNGKKATIVLQINGELTSN